MRANQCQLHAACMLFISRLRKVARVPRHWSGDGEAAGGISFGGQENVKVGLRGYA